MKFFAVLPTLLALTSAEAQFGLYPGYGVGALPYAAAYTGPVSSVVDSKFAYGTPITALNALPAAAPAPAVASYAAVPAIEAPVIAKAVPAVAAYAAAPVVAAAVPAPVVSSQYQAQDELGNIAYGYQNINSAKQESGNALGGVTGSYTYQDEAGVHTVNYVADQLGFRVQGDNLPVAPANLAVAPVHVAAPVVDTPEVVEAKAAFFKAYAAAESGISKRSAPVVPAGLPLTYSAGLNLAGVAGVPALNYAGVAGVPALNYAGVAGVPALNYAGVAGVQALNYAAAPAVATVAAPAVATVAAPAVAAPVAYAGVAGAPAREATLTTIKLNPGHATFYRVD